MCQQDTPVRRSSYTDSPATSVFERDVILLVSTLYIPIHRPCPRSSNETRQWSGAVSFRSVLCYATTVLSTDDSLSFPPHTRRRGCDELLSHGGRAVYVFAFELWSGSAAQSGSRVVSLVSTPAASCVYLVHRFCRLWVLHLFCPFPSSHFGSCQPSTLSAAVKSPVQLLQRLLRLLLLSAA
jgi:hypothetical protein